MANQKISDFAELTVPTGAEFVPVEDVAGVSNKKVSITNIVALASAGAMIKLHTGSGSSAATGATTVDSFNVTGLTIHDSLMILATMEANGNTASSPGFKNLTDGVAFATNSLTSNTDESYVAYIRNAQSSLTRVDYWQHGYQGTTLINDQAMRKTFTTNWTGTWSLGLVYSALGSGCTFTYSYTVYKILG